MNRRDGWLGTEEIARIMRCSTATVRRSLADPDRANRLYGPEHENWTAEPSPLGLRRAFQVRAAVIYALARKAGFSN